MNKSMIKLLIRYKILSSKGKIFNFFISNLIRVEFFKDEMDPSLIPFYFEYANTMMIKLENSKEIFSPDVMKIVKSESKKDEKDLDHSKSEENLEKEQ